jgi:hypothetical protein
VNNVSYKGKVEIVKAAKMEENIEEVVAKGEENVEEILKPDSPPSPPRARKLSRRSSVAIARRLSRASAAGVISLEEQLEIVPARDEAPTDARLTQVSERLRTYKVRERYRSPFYGLLWPSQIQIVKSVRVQFMQFLRDSGHTCRDYIVDLFLWNISESSRNSYMCFSVHFFLGLVLSYDQEPDLSPVRTRIRNNLFLSHRTVVFLNRRNGNDTVLGQGCG